jgi:hypothetical protein
VGEHEVKVLGEPEDCQGTSDCGLTSVPGSPNHPMSLFGLSGSVSHFRVKLFFSLFSEQLERGRAVMTVQEVGEVGLLGLSCFL